MHWLFCYIYLKQQIEVKYLLDRRIYSANQAIIIRRNLENFCLEFANIVNLLISVGILVWYLCEKKFYNDLIYSIVTGLEMLYLVTWSYTLCLLFARFKSSELLLPRKWVFMMHAVLLIVLLLSSITMILMIKIAFGSNCDATCFDIFTSIYYIALTVGDAREVTTFAYVV